VHVLAVLYVAGERTGGEVLVGFGGEKSGKETTWKT